MGINYFWGDKDLKVYLQVIIKDIKRIPSLIKVKFWAKIMEKICIE